MTPTRRPSKRKRKAGRPALGSDAERIRRGWFRPSRARDPKRQRSEAGANWLQGLSPDARLQGIWCLQYFVPGDRAAFRHYLDAHAELEQFYRAGHETHGPVTNADMEARNAAHAALRDRIATLSRAVGWRRR
jgi:hypothetical protein